MDRLAFVKRQFEYHAWAQDRAAKALAEAEKPHAHAVALLAHVVSADRVWLGRLHGKDMLAQDLWPEMTLADCRRQIESVRASYRDYLGGLAAADLDSVKPYKNSKGIPFETSAGDVLEQVIAHAAYHRGQIAAEMRREGSAPVNTDYITFVREAGKD
jgi:uncharacterized damage-inducible protein DinB